MFYACTSKILPTLHFLQYIPKLSIITFKYDREYFFDRAISYESDRSNYNNFVEGI